MQRRFHSALDSLFIAPAALPMREVISASMDPHIIFYGGRLVCGNCGQSPTLPSPPLTPLPSPALPCPPLPSPALPCPPLTSPPLPSLPPSPPSLPPSRVPNLIKLGPAVWPKRAIVAPPWRSASENEGSQP